MKEGGIFYRCISYAFHTILSLFFYLFRVFPIRKNKVAFSSFYGRGYGDNPKKICEALHNKKEGYDLVWEVGSDKIELPSYVRSIKIGSIRWIYEMCTAKVWVDNCRKAHYIRRRKNQHYIQTWHGDVCIKAVEADAAETLSKGYIKDAKNDSKMATEIVSSCEWRTKNIREAFWYNKDILRAELYRPLVLDENQKKELEQSIKNELKVKPETNILLYAPTFRKNQSTDSYNLDYEALSEILSKKFSGEWCVVVRLHPNVSHLQNSIKYSERVKNGSIFADINNLMAVSNILITDYSGIIFRTLRQEKPLFLYCPDYEQYIQEDRKLYFDLENFPASFAKSNQELHENILNFDRNEYQKAAASFVNELGYYSNDGVNIICDYIETKTEV